MVVCVCPCTGAPVLDHGAGNATASVPPASWLGWALKRARCTPGLDEAVQFTAPHPTEGGALGAPSLGAGAPFEPVFCSVSCLRKLFSFKGSS